MATKVLKTKSGVIYGDDVTAVRSHGSCLVAILRIGH